MKSILIASFLLLSISISAQITESCQTQFSEEMYQQFTHFIDQYYDENNQRLQETPPVQKYVKVTVHLVANNDGTKRIDTHRALLLMCALNGKFAQADIHFYLNEIKYINNSNFNSNSAGVTGAMPNSSKVSNTINVYILGDTPTSDICGVYYGSAVAQGTSGGSPDIVVMSKGCANASTYAHEIGHFLTLPHTFYGWEGNTTGNTGNAPSWAERVDGNNCTTAGDGLCDTPPDYLFQRWSNANCEASGTQYFSINGVNTPVELTDPTGTAFTVDGSNIMSYTSNSCMTMFTTDQIAAMHFNLTNYRSGYVVNNGGITSIDSVVVQNSPINNQVVPYDLINLDWAATPNATRYLLQVSFLPSFTQTTLVDEQIVNTNTATVVGLVPNRTYYWRIIPFNNSYTCNIGKYNNFKTGDFASSQEDVGIEEIQVFTAFPNPIKGNKDITLRIFANDTIDAEILVYNVGGQVVEQQNHTIITGMNYLQIEHYKLTNGVYFLTLKTNKGQATKKIVVMK